jgi:hypothetical protein
LLRRHRKRPKTDDRMKVILGNPTIIAAYKSGIPGSGKPFPDGSMNVEAGSGCPPPRFVASCGLSTTVLFLKWALTYVHQNRPGVLSHSSI